MGSATAAFQTFGDDPTRALLIFAGPPVLMLAAWPFSGNDAVPREPLGKYAAQTLALGGPLILCVLHVSLSPPEEPASDVNRHRRVPRSRRAMRRFHQTASSNGGHDVAPSEVLCSASAMRA